MKKFKASLDFLSQIITWSVGVLFLVLSITMIKDGVFWLWPLLLILAFCVAFVVSPRGYIVTAENIVIRRLIGDKRIARANITEVEKGEASELLKSIRLFGSGGLWGYFGNFSNDRLGSMSWYATKRLKNLVIIKTSDRKIMVVTPDDLDGFIESMKCTRSV